MWNYKDQEDWDDSNLSRGKGDPDTWGYPGEEVTHHKGVDKVVVRDNSTRRTNYPFDEDIDYDPRIDEDLEDNERRE